MLTPKTLKYRVQAGKFRMIITNCENAEKVDEVADACPLLETLLPRGGEREGWRGAIRKNSTTQHQYRNQTRQHADLEEDEIDRSHVDLLLRRAPPARPR